MSKIMTKKTIKLVTGILIPILIMISSIVMVGVSYAWFSVDRENRVSSISMTTEEAFTLSFYFENNPDTSNPDNLYKGELGYINSPGVGIHLVTSEFAQYGLGYTISEYDMTYKSYMSDKPYSVETEIVLDTQGKNVEFVLFISSVVVSLYHEDTGVTDQLMNLSSTDTINLIPYGFTWYLLDSGANKIYSPYGTEDGGNILTASNPTKWQETPELRSINNFSKNNASMKLYVVFCPEKLYWYQYSAGIDGRIGINEQSYPDWMALLTDIYSTDEHNMIKHLDSYGNTTSPYNPTSSPDLSGSTYSSSNYVGANFEFNFTLEVLNVDKNTNNA